MVDYFMFMKYLVSLIVTNPWFKQKLKVIYLTWYIWEKVVSLSLTLVMWFCENYEICDLARVIKPGTYGIMLRSCYEWNNMSSKDSGITNEWS